MWISVHRNWKLVGHFQSVPLYRHKLLGIVCHENHLRHAEVRKDLRAYSVVTLVFREPKAQVGVDCVRTLILQYIGAKLVVEANATALLMEVHDNPCSRSLDPLHRPLQLLAAVAPQAAKRVSGETLRMHPDEDWTLCVPKVSLDESHVLLAGNGVQVGMGDEVTRSRGHRDFHDLAHELFVVAAVSDQVRNRDDRNAVPFAKGNEAWHASHRPIVVHDLADDCRRGETSKFGQVDRCFSLTSANEHPSLSGTQRKDVPGAREVFRPRRRIDCRTDRVCTILR